MRICSCILQTHSSENEDLYQLTLLNHAQYAARHSYDMIQLNIVYGELLLNPYAYMLDVFEKYDFVFTIGSDVVITNPAPPFESFLQKHCVAISLEDIGGSQCNFDTVVWGPGKVHVIEQLQKRQAEWINHPWGMQEAFNILFREKSPLVRFVPLREMQSTHVKGFPKSMWQPGDFICHFLGAPNDDKYRRIQHFLETGTILWRD